MVRDTMKGNEIVPNEPPALEQSPERFCRPPAMTKRQYYLREAVFVVLMCVWFAGWYLVMRFGSNLGAIIQVILFLLFFFTQPTGIPFEPYEKAMKRLEQTRGERPRQE